MQQYIMFNTLLMRLPGLVQCSALNLPELKKKVLFYGIKTATG